MVSRAFELVEYEVSRVLVDFFIFRDLTVSL